MVVVAASCSGSGPVPAPPQPSALTTTAAPTAATVPSQLSDLEQRTVTVAGVDLRVVVAATGSARRRGLMGIVDLGPLDGMVFVFDEDTSGGFWMKDTLIPLRIAFFSAAGDLVDSLSMVPCEADPCPVYSPRGSYRYALEVPEGRMPPLDPSARMQLGG